MSDIYKLLLSSIIDIISYAQIHIILNWTKAIFEHTIYTYWTYFFILFCPREIIVIVVLGKVLVFEYYIL